MAQFCSAPPLGAGCRRFESCHPDHFFCGCSSMVELQPSKLVTRVRFPSPAPGKLLSQGRLSWLFCFNKVEGIEPASFITYDKQHARGALVITRYRCSLAFTASSCASLLRTAYLYLSERTQSNSSTPWAQLLTRPGTSGSISGEGEAAR